MAYNNKYTLDFGDVEGHSYRLIIQERGYTGTSSQVKGGKSPIVIRYDGEDNEYGSIYGSSATIQIWEESLKQFDDLVFTSEKEHRVILKYLDPGSSTYKNYWIGFLVADDMARDINPLPNLLKFKAFDGLSLLKGRDSYLVPRETGNQFNKILYHILKMININDDNETTTLQFWNATNYYHIEYLLNNSVLSDRILTFLYVTTPYQFKNGYGRLNAKEQLTYIMQAIGARIYQSQGYWMIDQNQGQFDSYIQNEYRERARDNVSGVAVSNTFNFVRNRLRNTLNYNTLWHKYGSGSGNFFANQIESRLYIAPEKLKPIDLKEFYRPRVKSIENEVDINQFKKDQIWSNSGMEYVGNGNPVQVGFHEGWSFGGYPTTAQVAYTSQWIRCYSANNSPTHGANFRKQGGSSFFTKAITPMTSVYHNGIRAGTQHTPSQTPIAIMTGQGSNIRNVKGFTENLRVEANVYVHMDPIPQPLSAFSNIDYNEVRLPYRIILYELDSSGNIDINNPKKYWRSNDGNVDFSFESRSGWQNSISTYRGGGQLRVRKEDYNKWLSFSGEISSPYGEFDSEADTNFAIRILFYPAFLYFGDAFQSNASNLNDDVFPEYKGTYYDNVQLYVDDSVDSPKTFVADINDNTADDSEKIKIKARGIGNYVGTADPTIDNFTTRVFARPQSIYGTTLDEKREKAKQLPQLINQDLANNHQDRQKYYEGTFKLMDPNKRPMFFSDRIWMGWGITDFNTPGNNDFSECDDNLVTINKMVFNPKENEYKLSGNLNVISQVGNGDTDITEDVKVGDD